MNYARILLALSAANMLLPARGETYQATWESLEVWHLHSLGRLFGAVLGASPAKAFRRTSLT